MADGRHFRNRLLAITQQPNVQFQWKFAQGSRIARRYRSGDKNSKFQKFKMVDCRHIANRKVAIFQRKINRFWWNLVHCIVGTRLQPDDQIWKCSKFKMANGCHFKNSFWPVSRLPDFSRILCEEAVFPQNFSNETDTGVPQNVVFVFLMQFGLRRAAPFVSSPIHLFKSGFTINLSSKV